MRRSCFLLLLLVACRGGGAQAPREDMQTPVEIKLTVQPQQLSMAERSSFMIGFEATNRSGSTVDPRLYDMALEVNGARAPAWDLAIQNGPRDASWDELPPGKSVSMSWPLGEALFENPGDYHLEISLDGAKSTRDVKVVP